MSALRFIARHIWAEQRRTWLTGLLLATLVLAAGIGLLGLSGWFVTASGAAGLAGIGIAFDFFRPSAGVRLLAMGRTAARYGERLVTHDATLRSLAALRAALLGALAGLPYREMVRVRGARALNRITADVDALDGLPLRLVIPLVAGLTALLGTLALLAWLTAPVLALWSVLSYTAGLAAALAFVVLRSRAEARRAETGFQALRTRVVDMLRGQTELVMSGQLGDQRAAVMAADERVRAAERALERSDRIAGFAMQAAGTLDAAGAFAIGAFLVQQGTLSPARLALAFFATLALAEIGPALRRGLAEFGRMADAARRVQRLMEGRASAGAAPARPAPAEPPAEPAGAAGLALEDLTQSMPEGGRILFEDVSFSVAPGERVALTGRSGCGKSTLLLIAAGLVAPCRGRVRVDGRPVEACPEAELRMVLGLLPQRSALMSGSLREAVRLGAADLTDVQIRAVLEAVALGPVLDRLGGLDAPLGEGGAGLSGGERRRLALARVLARRPSVLLLDEPMEGLDRATAEAVLAGIHDFLPHAAVLVAAHREAERAWADREVSLDAAARQETVISGR